MSKPVYVEFDNNEPGHPGVTIYFDDGTKSWYDARGRRVWEKINLPEEEWIDNLPQNIC